LRGHEALTGAVVTVMKVSVQFKVKELRVDKLKEGGGETEARREQEKIPTNLRSSV
jgi:hypothetical protein